MTYEEYVPETTSTVRKVQSLREIANDELMEVTRKSDDPATIHEGILTNALVEGEESLAHARKSLAWLRIIEPNHRYGDVPRLLTEMVNHIEQLKENL